MHKFLPYAILLSILFTSPALMAQVTPVHSTQVDGFVPNRGQVINQNGQPNTTAAYLWSSGNGLNVQLRPDGFGYDTYAPAADGTMALHRLDLRFAGVNPEVTLHAEQPLEGHINFHNPHRRGEQTTRLGAFGKIVYESLYPGIDLVATVGQGESGPHFKYDFVLAPGADASQIVMEYSGYDGVVAEASQLKFTLSGAELTEYIPLSYTSSGRSVDVVYRTLSNSATSLRTAFDIPESEAPQSGESLTIDPIALLQWATYYGDSLSETAHAITIDTLGVVFVAGRTQSLAAMASEGAHQSTYAGGQYDAFLARFNQHGLRQWATYYGGSGDDAALGVAMGTFDQIYLVGYTTSPDSVGSGDSYQPENAGGKDGFIAQFDRFGVLIWDTFLGGAADDQVVACASTPQGDLFVAGTSFSSSFAQNDSLPLVFSQNHSGDSDAFVAKFTVSGAPLWATFLGGSQADVATSVAVGPDLSVVVGGYTASPSGLATANAFQQNLSGPVDGFLALYNAQGSKQWASYYGGEGIDHITSVVADSSIFICGSSDAQLAYTDSLSHQPEHAGVLDAFVMRLDSVGAPVWCTHFGGDSLDIAAGIATDKDGLLYLVGSTFSENGIAMTDTIGPAMSSYRGNGDVFVANFTRHGQQIWGHYVGGSGAESGNAIAAYGYTAAFFAGSTHSADSIVTAVGQYAEIHQENFGGGDADVLLGRITQIRSTAPLFCTGGEGWNGGNNNTPQPIGLCIGDSIRLSIAGGCLGLDAEWMWYAEGCGNTDQLIGEGASLWVSPATTTTYYVRAESVYYVSQCATATVHVDYPPTASAGVTDSICAGGAAQFAADGAIHFAWTGPMDFESAVQNPLVDSLTVTNTGTYTVVVSTQFGCTDTASVWLTVLPSPSPQIAITHVSCIGSADGVATVLNPDTLGTTYFWPHSGEESTVAGALEAGSYTLISTSAYGCTSIDSLLILSPLHPLDSVHVVHAECDNKEGAITLHLNNSGAPQVVVWDPSGHEGTTLSGIPGGNYTATITTANGCAYQEAVTVGNGGFFQVVLSPDTLLLEIGNVASLLPTIIPPAEGLTYLWWPAETLSCNDCPNPVANPTEDVTYHVWVTSAAGCAAGDSIHVIRERVLSRPFLPTAFSPNGDGLNDQLCVLSDRIAQLRLEIYNRRGDLVFKAADKSECWDGTYRGAPVAGGAYVYHLELALDDGEVYIRSGNLSVVR